MLIVGAGISGLSCAKHLHDRGIAVRVIDQGYRIGGRCSTRRTYEGEVIADHGTPSFEAKDPEFEDAVSEWIASGICAQWTVDRYQWTDDSLKQENETSRLYIGNPTMDAIAFHLASGIAVQSETRVLGLHRKTDGNWCVETESRDGVRSESTCTHVVIATHPREAVRLIGDHSSFLTSTLEHVQTACVWVLMMRIDDPLEGLPVLVEVSEGGDGIIATIIRDDHKPNRACDTNYSTLVIHACSDWSSANRDLDRDEAQRLLTEHTRSLLSSMLGHDIDDHRFGVVQVHRWGSAHPVEGLPQLCETDDDARIMLCGDAFGWKELALGVQSAWMSGRAAAAVLADGLG